MDAQGEGERRPMNRDQAQQVLVDNQPHDPQRRLPDPSYPRSAEGILRMCAVVSSILESYFLFSLFLPIYSL